MRCLNNTHSHSHRSKHSVWARIPLFAELFVLAVGVWLCFQTRNVPSDFNEGRWMLVSLVLLLFALSLSTLNSHSHHSQFTHPQRIGDLQLGAHRSASGAARVRFRHHARRAAASARHRVCRVMHDGCHEYECESEGGGEVVSAGADARAVCLLAQCGDLHDGCGRSDFRAKIIQRLQRCNAHGSHRNHALTTPQQRTTQHSRRRRGSQHSHHSQQA